MNRIRKMCHSQEGFTLVEIAIVMIIIGLLIGGIIKGQAMIKNAKVKRLVSDVDGLRAAILTYQDKFGMLPGDENDANTPSGDTFNGNNNGLMNEAAGQAFSDMRLAEILPGTGLTLPQHAFGGNLQFIQANISGSGNVNWIEALNVPGEVCQEIDSKYDDGVQTTGEIRGTAAYTAGTTVPILAWRF
ncbi:MAG: prepilin-type N-terminal cleavage/methylation domain-containing protein [Pseudomonadota bacterium]